MKRGYGAGFPLALLLTLAALTAWLRYAVELPDDARDGKLRHDPDYVVDGARASRLDAGGRLRYTMHGERLVHFPDDDTSEVTRPYLVFLNPPRPLTTVTAQHAKISADGDEVVLTDKVQVQRAASEKQAALVAAMDHLTVYPDSERAITDARVEITEGASWLRGTGMEVDNKTQVFVLKSKVTGQFETKRSRERS